MIILLGDVLMLCFVKLELLSDIPSETERDTGWTMTVRCYTLVTSFRYKGHKLKHSQLTEPSSTHLICTADVL